VVAARRQPAHQQQRRQQQQTQQKPKPQKPTQGHRQGSNPYNRDSSAASGRHSASSGWQCASVIDQQSSEVLEKLLLAAETRRGGATIKSLTLAPHIIHKKPTFAVTCETLKHLPLLKQLVADAGLLEQHQQQVIKLVAPSVGHCVSFIC
jgi:putative methyltransferase